MDPEILLKAKAFNLAIGFFYSGQSGTDREYGRRRSASVHGHVHSVSGAGSVTVMHGDFRTFKFTEVGTSGGVGRLVDGCNLRRSSIQKGQGPMCA